MGSLDRQRRLGYSNIEGCGSGSVVERLLAKEKVAGSNPVFRSSEGRCFGPFYFLFVLSPRSATIAAGSTVDAGAIRLGLR